MLCSNTNFHLERDLVQNLDPAALARVLNLEHVPYLHQVQKDG